MYVHTYIYTYIHTCIYTYVHTYMHTYIHTYIHTCAHTVPDTSYVFMQNCRVDFPQYTVQYIMGIFNSRPQGARRLLMDFRTADRMYRLRTCTSSLYVGVKTAMFIGSADKVRSPTLTRRCRAKCSGQTDVRRKQYCSRRGVLSGKGWLEWARK